MSGRVAVIGGGSAGMAAAVAAARAGARVTLVERYGYLGGMGTASLVHTFCGLYDWREDEAVVVHGGVAAEVEAALRREGLAGNPVRMGRVWVLPHDPVGWAAYADRWVAEAGVEVWLHSELASVERVGALWRLGVLGRGMRRELEAEVLVDASGDAVVAAALGGGFEMAEPARLQRPAYVFGVRVEPGVSPEAGRELAARLVGGVRSGALDPRAMGLQFRAGVREGEWYGTLDLAGDEAGWLDPLDVSCLGELERIGRRVAWEAVGWMAREVPGWQGARVSHWPVRAGVRESRRWVGEEMLTGEQVLAGRPVAGGVVKVSWPMEMRETARGPKLRFPEGGGMAEVALGCLRPKGRDRLWVAGRCLSCDHEAQGAVRVMGICLATGEAAGKEAAREAEG